MAIDRPLSLFNTLSLYHLHHLGCKGIVGNTEPNLGARHSLFWCLAQRDGASRAIFQQKNMRAPEKGMPSGPYTFPAI